MQAELPFPCRMTFSACFILYSCSVEEEGCDCSLILSTKYFNPFVNSELLLFVRNIKMGPT